MSQPGGDGRGPVPPGGPQWPQQQQYPQQPQQPYPQQQQYPQQPQQYPQQQPYPQQQQQPYPQQQQEPYPQPQPSGVAMVGAIRRAFRMRIDPSEVTPRERARLERAGVTSPGVQAFLAWRRSLLSVVATALIPIVGLEIYGLTDGGDDPEILKTLNTVGVVINVAFVLVLLTQLGRWTQWRKQRRVITVAWLIYFLAPFVMFLYPIRNAFEDQMAQMLAQVQAGGDQAAIDAAATAAKVAGPLVGLVASLMAMMQLAPKAVSIMPGLLRGSITAKLLFPGASGPGWLVLVMAPIYAMLMYVVLMMPYQLTGSGYFVAAMIGLIGAQVWLGRMGYRLARPESLEEALVLVKKVRTGYFLLNVTGLVFIAIGLGGLVKAFGFPVMSVVQTLLSFLANVLLLTLISTDLVVANLARGQRALIAPGVAQAQAVFQRDVSHFVDPEVTSTPR